MNVQNNWVTELENKIKYLGHRNWIVVSDEAYPLQSNPGITSLLSSDNHIDTIDMVKTIIDKQSHIKPIIYLDKEIDFVNDTDAPGIEDFRNKLNDQFDAQSANKLLHEDIIGMLDEASKLFNVVIIKTNFTIPYTTVFFQLDCKYWNADAEKRLRKHIEQGKVII